MIFFVTTNAGKFREVSALLGTYGVELGRDDRRYPEVQADTLEEVVAYAVEVLAAQLPGDFLVDDSGLFVNALKGFPGVYSSYVYRTIGLSGLLRLLEAVDHRQARFETVMGLRLDESTHVFRGECRGMLAFEPRGTRGFGFDPAFVPDGDTRTFAEMSTEEKNAVSHRGKAARALGEFLMGR